MYRLYFEPGSMAVYLRLTKDGQDVATTMVPLSQATKLLGKQFGIISFEPTTETSTGDSRTTVASQ